MLSNDDLKAVKKEVTVIVRDAVKFADDSPNPPAGLAKKLEFPTPTNADYDGIPPPLFANSVNKRTISTDQMDMINVHIEELRDKARRSEITISEAANLAIHEEMLRDPRTTSELFSK